MLLPSPDDLNLMVRTPYTTVVTVQTFHTFNHMNQSIRTSWCFMKNNADHIILNEDRDLCARVRKAYRPETYVGTIVFSSYKYRPTSGMLRSLVGYSCDFQWT